MIKQEEFIFHNMQLPENDSGSFNSVFNKKESYMEGLKNGVIMIGNCDIGGCFSIYLTQHYEKWICFECFRKYENKSHTRG